MTIGEAKSVSYVLIASSCVTIVACLWVVLKGTNALMINRAYCDLGFCLQLIVFETVVLFQVDKLEQLDDTFSPYGCGVFAAVTQFMMAASLLWYTVNSYDYYKSVSNPFQRPTSRLRRYHLIVWPLALASAIALYNMGTGYRPALHLCWTDPEVVWLNFEGWLVLEAWLCVFGLYSLAVLCYCWIKQRDGEYQKTLTFRKKMLRSQQSSVFLYTMFWFCLACMWAWLYNGSLAPDGMAIVLRQPFLRHLIAAFLPLFGTLNALVMFSGDQFWHWWSTKSRTLLVLYEAQGGNTDLTEHISDMLRTEFIARTTEGIRLLTEDPHPEEDKSWRVKHYSRHRQKTLKQESKRQNSCLRCFAVCFGDTSAVIIREYAAAEFRHLRKDVFNLDDETYLASLTGGSDHHVEQMAKNFSEGGVSGAFFYFSADHKLVIKTIKKSEKDLLMSVLHPYVRHMAGDYGENRVFSLVTKLYGCYSIRMHGVVQYFCVMENVLWSNDVTLHERYDIKGSWINRHGTFGGVLRDNDLYHRLQIPFSRRRRIFKSLWRDVAFLASIQIMDYSLLLGIHFCSELRSSPNTHCVANVDEMTRKGLKVPSDASRNKHPSRSKDDCEWDRHTKRHTPGRRRSLGAIGSRTRRKKHPAEQTDVRISFHTPLLSGMHRERTFSDVSRGELEKRGSDEVGDDDAMGEADGVQFRSLAETQESNERLETWMEGQQGRPFGEQEGFREESRMRHRKSALGPTREGDQVLRDFFGGCSSEAIRGPGIYYLGIVDILQRWTLSKRIENFFKSLRHGKHGITAVPPRVYAERLLLKLRTHLDLPLCALAYTDTDIKVRVVEKKMLNARKWRKEMQKKLRASTVPGLDQRLIDPHLGQSEEDGKHAMYLVEASWQGIVCQNWEPIETLMQFNCPHQEDFSLNQSSWARLFSWLGWSKRSASSSAAATSSALYSVARHTPRGSISTIDVSAHGITSSSSGPRGTGKDSRKKLT